VTANGVTAAGVGEPFGLRNVQGLFNNISLSSSAIWGAAFYAFARTSDADYGHYLQQRIDNHAFSYRIKVDSTDQALVNNLNGTGSPGAGKLWGQMTSAEKALVQDSTYGVQIANGNVDLSQRNANPFLTVYDYSPRTISQLVDSQTALERVDAASGGAYITDTITYDLTDINTGTTKSITESFQRNLNTLSGDPTLTGWNVLFGQFFDHGLDFIGKGGNTVNGKSSKIYIPLDPSDPLYRAPVYDTNGNLVDPGNTKLFISRATVVNPDAAGADGMFRTADDIQSPGKDGQYGTADDIIGPTDPKYVNYTSPYIDQSQTYGSDDTTANLLREWVKDPITDKYAPGMYLFDGNTLANAWNRQNPDGTVTATKRTLPNLNELRAYLLTTGRDDLSWGDIDNLRVRDANGKVLDLDPNAAGIQAKLTDHTLIADYLPRIDADHLFNSKTVLDLKGTSGYVDPLSSFDAAHIQRPNDSTDPSGTYISDYINLQSGQPTALGTTASGGAIVNEILLRSIGDHYVAGDGRANENFGLTAIHHVWHEDHNWQIDNLINIIAQQQAADPSHTVAHAFQINTGTIDSKGNYIYSNGAIAWNQDKMFLASQTIVQKEYQHVAIDQYARGMSPNIPLFVQYDSGVNSDVTLDYSQVAFRFGHSQLRETIDTLDPNGSLTAAVTHYALEQAFLNPSGFAKVGPTVIAQGMTRQASNEIDEIVTPALQQNLLGQATDLAAINIARGRDLGMPTLNNLRRQLSSGLTAELNTLNQKLIANPGDTNLRQTIDKTIALQAGLQAYSSWADFGNNIQHPEALVSFVAAYSFDGDLAKAEVLMKLANGGLFTSLSAGEKTIINNGLGWNFGDDISHDIDYAIKANQFLNGEDKGYESIDAWNGGLAEKHVFLGELGPTFDAIFADQMTRLINGDRFYYFWRLQLGLPIFTELSSAVTTEQFKDVIERTTGAKHLVGDVFLMADSYVETREMPTSVASGAARDHKYGDLLTNSTDSNLLANGQHIGVASIGGSNETLNGYVVNRITGQNANGTNIVEKFILDVRPDIGTNPDGTASRGFNAHEVIGGTQFRDYIDAGDGDDTIYGDDGNDILLGNAGADHIYGEGGNDLIMGESA
jgi:Animal haem peroxidase/RTX calcium-binding nonapeptide repeat (4 copies)